MQVMAAKAIKELRFDELDKNWKFFELDADQKVSRQQLHWALYRSGVEWDASLRGLEIDDPADTEPHSRLTREEFKHICQRCHGVISPNQIFDNPMHVQHCCE